MLYFTAETRTHGRELWKSDGTRAGTLRVTDLAAGVDSLGIHGLANVYGTLYFETNDGRSGAKPWLSDGTWAGTVPMNNVYAVTKGSGFDWAVVDGRFFFTAQGRLWALNRPTPTRATDFDADGRADLAVFRPSTGQWIIHQSRTGAVRVQAFGVPNLYDIPVAGDFDGDGRADLAVFRPATGQWIIHQSRTGAVWVQVFGATNLYDIPIAADYDGDGKADLAVFRPATGQWIIHQSRTGAVRVQAYGLANLADVPIPADYDGDGKADLAVFRTSTAQWLILNSSGGFRAQTYGFPRLFDVPIPADYDGDGRADLAVFRPSTGQWIIQQSRSDTIRVQGYGLRSPARYPRRGADREPQTLGAAPRASASSQAFATSAAPATTLIPLNVVGTTDSILDFGASAREPGCLEASRGRPLLRLAPTPRGRSITVSRPEPGREPENKLGALELVEPLGEVAGRLGRVGATRPVEQAAPSCWSARRR